MSDSLTDTRGEVSFRRRSPPKRGQYCTPINTQEAIVVASVWHFNIARTGFASDEIATQTLDLDTRRLTPDPEATFA